MIPGIFNGSIGRGDLVTWRSLYLYDRDKVKRLTVDICSCNQKVPKGSQSRHESYSQPVPNISPRIIGETSLLDEMHQNLRDVIGPEESR